MRTRLSEENSNPRIALQQPSPPVNEERLIGWLFFDLDETLIQWSQSIPAECADFISGPYRCMIRPHAFDLIEECLGKYSVGIGTSAGVHTREVLLRPCSTIPDNFTSCGRQNAAPVGSTSKSKKWFLSRTCEKKTSRTSASTSTESSQLMSISAISETYFEFVHGPANRKKPNFSALPSTSIASSRKPYKLPLGPPGR